MNRALRLLFLATIPLFAEASTPMTSSSDPTAAPTPAPRSPRQEYRLAQAASGKQERIAHFQAGIDAAEQILATRPDDSEALLWLAANLGQEALQHGKLYALNVLPRMEELLLRLDQLDPGYEHGAAARTLGELYHAAPPIISIGSEKKAHRYYDKALQLGPEHPGNQALAARSLYARGQYSRALELARKALANPDLQKYPVEAPEWRELAEKIVRKASR